MNDHIHPVFQQALNGFCSEATLRAREHDAREQLQVLEAWKVTASDLKRKAIDFLGDTLRLELMEIDVLRRFGPSSVQTNSDEPGYWEAKDRDLKAEREGLSSGAPEDENFGDA